MSKRKVTIIVIASLVFFTLLMIGLTFKNRKNKEQEEEVKSNVQYAKVMLAMPSLSGDSIKLNGVVENAYTLDLFAEVTGTYNQGSVRLKPGVKFSKGAVLVRIYDQEFEANIKSQKAGFKSLMIGLLPDIELEFESELPKWEKYIASIKIDKILPELPSTNSDKERNFLFSRNVQSQYMTIKSLDARHSKYVIRAPFNGEVVDNFIEPGGMISMGTRIATIMKTGETELRVPMTVIELQNLNKTKGLDVYNQTGEKVGEARYDREGRVINTATQSLNVYFRLYPTKKGKVYINQTLTVSIRTKDFEDVVKLPRTAVTNGKVQLWTKKDSSIIGAEVLEKMVSNEFIYVEGLDSGVVVVQEEVKLKNDSVTVIPIY